MVKPKPQPASYADMIDLPDDPVDAPAAPVRAAEPEPEPKAKPATVEVPAVRSMPEPVKRAASSPTAETKPEPGKPAKGRKDSPVPSRREAARLRRMEPKPEPADYAQRSLYAREDTFKRFRALAYAQDVPAQALYREGLFLVLQKYGQADGLALDDM